MHRRASAAVAFLLACVLAAVGASPARAAGTGYVALGDSYSSGLGAGSYEASSGTCDRSSKAYPSLWAKAHKPASFAFTACASATTTDVVHRQLGPLSRSTGLVSISVGGNDAGFGDVMTACLTSSTNACEDRIARARTFIRNRLPGLLDTTYTAIRSRAPKARVVALGYPRLYAVPGTCLLGLSDTVRRALDSAADDLDGVIAKRAAGHGFAFADVRGRFAKHELCSNSPWLHSVTLPPSASYHPTATGQSGGYLRAFTDAA
ncbi:SGNH/GDSL hydrolase family protein [Actinacidiphila yeochonensis]|uniref:SGNH/GDSL hydrolase family protein n=1 Tax=Actinacidiphila yeochonensis TaxID=89050 RepID=UPI000568199B|nr:SGNH/GDSL hydrolase family protein [Actinacidiphila yeochonensis]